MPRPATRAEMLHGTCSCTCTSTSLNSSSNNNNNNNHNNVNNDWDNFPPAVKRKYFSSLEKLRLAQHSTSAIKSASVKSCHGALKASKPNPPASRPALARRNSSYFKNPHILRRKAPSPTSETFLPSEAQWYLSLPDKVKRRHFTKEERLALSGHRDSFVPIPDDSNEKPYNFYKQGKEGNRSVPTLRTSSFSSLSSLSTLDNNHPVDTAIDMDDSMIWFDDDNDLDLSSKLQLDDYHDFVTKAAESDVKPSTRRPSFRRALSLNQLPYGANTSPVPPLPKTTFPTPFTTIIPPQPIHQHVQSRPSLAAARRAQTSNSAIEASAKYYQDPEARLKLRVYLASPQNFDEAIEFGFPSMEDIDDRSLSRPSLSRAHNTAPSKTFLHDDIPSLFDGLDGDDDAESTTSLPERDAPYTPMNSRFNHDAMLLSPSEATSCCSSSTLFSKSAVRHHTSEPFAQMLAGGREMTLRMTLTRPDLRADEKALYASTTGDDPLALEHLPPTKKVADIWDQIPKESGALKKFWKRVSGKGS